MKSEFALAFNEILEDKGLPGKSFSKPFGLRWFLRTENR